MGYASIPTDLTGYSKISSGNYTGNDSVNRAIPHGLGVVPKIIHIGYRSIANTYKILESGKISYVSDTSNGVYTVTAIDSTNFYVGNATSYPASCNGNTIVYDWVAIG